MVSTVKTGPLDKKANKYTLPDDDIPEHPPPAPLKGALYPKLPTANLDFTPPRPRTPTGKDDMPHPPPAAIIQPRRHSLMKLSPRNNKVNP